MVYFVSVVSPPVTLFMGNDKYESELFYLDMFYLTFCIRPSGTFTASWNELLATSDLSHHLLTSESSFV